MRSDMYRFTNPFEMTDGELFWANRVVGDYVRLMSCWRSKNEAVLLANIQLAKHQLHQIETELRRRDLT